MSAAGGLEPKPLARSKSGRRPYRPPAIERLGDLRSLTLGATGGVPDSGMGITEFPNP